MLHVTYVAIVVDSSRLLVLSADGVAVYSDEPDANMRSGVVRGSVRAVTYLAADDTVYWADSQTQLWRTNVTHMISDKVPLPTSLCLVYLTL